MKVQRQHKVGGDAGVNVDQQEELSSSGANAWNNLWVYKLVPWLNWDEWDRVRVSLFSSSSESVASALDRISAWHSRGCLPMAIETTAAVFVVHQKDPFFRKDKPPEAFYDSDGNLADLYSMAIVRLVNGAIEKTRKWDTSMNVAAKEFNIPRLLIDARHECSHREIPSLPILRKASIQAIEWLKKFYWEPQIIRLQHKKGICFQAGQEVGVSFHFQAREVAEAKLCGVFCLMKEHNLASSSKVISKDNRYARRSFFTTVKFLSTLYCSYPLEVASVLLELFLKEDVQHDHGAFEACWKYLTEELSKQRPHLLITLLGVLIDAIETQDVNKNETGKLLRQMMVPSCGRKAYPIELLYALSAELVSLLKQLKPSLQKTSYVVSEVPSLKQIPRAMLVALARRFLLVAAHVDKQLMTTAQEVVRLLDDETPGNKLNKHTLRALDNAEVNPILDTSAEQNQNIQIAIRKLKAVGNISQEKAGRSRWRIAEFWSPCPIGMLPPDANFSHNHIPVLDGDAEVLWTSKTIKAGRDKDDPGSKSRGKRSKADVTEDINTTTENGRRKKRKKSGCESEEVA